MPWFRDYEAFGQPSSRENQTRKTQAATRMVHLWNYADAKAQETKVNV